MASEKLVQDMHRIVDDTTSLPIDQLVSSPGKWGPINFEMAKAEIQRSFAILGYLKILPIEILPESVLAAIRDHATNFLNAVISIRKFSIEEGGDPATRRNQIVDQIRAYSENLFTASQSYIPFLAYQRGDIEQNIRHLTDSVTQGKDIISQAKEDAAQSKKELDEIIRASREASATVGVGHFTQDFQTEADSLKDSAGSWLTATIILATVTLILSISVEH